MEGVLDTGFSLSYRDQVLSFLFPLFPPPVTGDSSPHVHSLTRLLVTLSSPSLTVPFITSLVPKEKLLAYQFAFDLVEGGSQDFLESVRTEIVLEHQGNLRQAKDHSDGPGVGQAVPRIPQAKQSSRPSYSPEHQGSFDFCLYGSN